ATLFVEPRGPVERENRYRLCVHSCTHERVILSSSCLSSLRSSLALGKRARSISLSRWFGWINLFFASHRRRSLLRLSLASSKSIARCIALYGLGSLSLFDRDGLTLLSLSSNGDASL